MGDNSQRHAGLSRFLCTSPDFWLNLQLRWDLYHAGRAEAADVLGIASYTVSRVLNGHAGISPDMAIRLEKSG